MLGGGGEAVADGGKVARAAAVERQARERAREVGRRGERGADRLAAAGVGEHPGDGVEAAADDRRVGRGTGEPAGEEPRARRR